MPCLLVLLGLLVPRVVMVIIYLFTNWFAQVFDTWLWPLLGFLFMPYTTLAYMAAVLNRGSNITLGWLIVIIIAALVDIANWGGGYRTRRRRRVVV